MQVHLIDGTYELFRSHFGAPPAHVDGRPVGAVRGLVGTLLALLRAPGVTHVGIAFDTVIESFRNALFAGYKTGAGIDPDLWAQFPLAEEATRALGLVTWSMIDFEADDALATCAARASDDPRVERILLCSPDKDLCQCVDGTRVVLFDRKQDKLLDADAVRAKFGVAPSSIPDLLALVGDDADGIPGIPGWGLKSAGALLGAYRALEAIPADWSSWAVKVRGAEKLSIRLEASREEARLYKVLATLRRDVPIGESIDALAWDGPRDDAIVRLAVTLGDARLLDRVRQVREQRR